MIVNTKYGEFNCEDINRKERRKWLKKAKKVFKDQEPDAIHDLCDEFAIIAFKDDKGIEKALKELSAIQEDEILIQIVCEYMGVDLGKLTGD